MDRQTEAITISPLLFLKSVGMIKEIINQWASKTCELFCLLGNFACYFVVCEFFFQNQLLRKFLLGISLGVKQFGSRFRSYIFSA